MIAYVFWHVPREGVAARDYESAHRSFHDALAGSSVRGLLGVRIHRLASIPWLGGRAGYEDWHLLADSASLDVLNAAAVSGMRRVPHDAVAAMAGEGTAGIYGVRVGRPCEASAAYWFAKPAGTGYAELDGRFAGLATSGGCLWGRRMTLGPTPEFCLHAATDELVPEDATRMPIELIHARDFD